MIFVSVVSVLVAVIVVGGRVSIGSVITATTALVPTFRLLC